MYCNAFLEVGPRRHLTSIHKNHYFLQVARTVVPAVDDHGSGIGKFALFSVYLSEEAEDAAGLLRHAVVWPAHVLVVPHNPNLLGLHGRKKEFQKKKSYIFFVLFFSLNELHTEMFVSYRVKAAELQNSDFVICGLPL